MSNQEQSQGLFLDHTVTADQWGVWALDQPLVSCLFCLNHEINGKFRGNEDAGGIVLFGSIRNENF